MILSKINNIYFLISLKKKLFIELQLDALIIYYDGADNIPIVFYKL